MDTHNQSKKKEKWRYRTKIKQEEEMRDNYEKKYN